MVCTGAMSPVWVYRLSANPPPQICDALPAQAIVHAVLEVLEALVLQEEKVAAVEELDEDSWAEVTLPPLKVFPQ